MTSSWTKRTARRMANNSTVFFWTTKLRFCSKLHSSWKAWTTLMQSESRICCVKFGLGVPGVQIISVKTYGKRSLVKPPFSEHSRATEHGCGYLHCRALCKAARLCRGSPVDHEINTACYYLNPRWPPRKWADTNLIGVPQHASPSCQVMYVFSTLEYWINSVLVRVPHLIIMTPCPNRVPLRSRISRSATYHD